VRVTKLCLGVSAAAVVASCSSASASRSVIESGSIEVGPDAGALWIAPEDVELYECTVGLLVCQDGIGRRSDRLCRCLRD
jgi:hypothetical protein